MDVGLTRRGRIVLAATVLAFVMAGLFGPRSLNAVVAPALVAFAIGAYRLSAAERPLVERVSPEAGFPGDARTVELRVEGGTDLPAAVEDRVGDGLAAKSDNRVEVTLDRERVTYEVELLKRGVHEIGPSSVTITDDFGLLARELRYPDRSEAVVYPEVVELAGPGRYDLAAFPEAERARSRQEFDRVREYERGDSLRDIHWKTSAKRPHDELVVKQFVDETDPGGITLVAEGPTGRADEVATAAASVAAYLLDAGMSVGVVVADGSVPEGSGPRHRREVLALLARTGAGEVESETRERADVRVRAAASRSATGGTVRSPIHVGANDHRTTFERMVGEDAFARADRRRRRDRGSAPGRTSVRADGGQPSRARRSSADRRSAGSESSGAGRDRRPDPADRSGVDR